MGNKKPMKAYEPTPQQEEEANELWHASAELYRAVSAYTEGCDRMREAADAAMAVGIPFKEISGLVLPDMSETAKRVLSGIVKSAAADRTAASADPRVRPAP